MGLIDFVKDAGKNLFGIGNDDEEAAEALTEAVRRTGIEVDDLEIQVDDDVATVQGTVPSQSDREKVVLIVGNNEGIGRVDDRLSVQEPESASEPEPESTYYTVQSGDTLSEIAQRHYGEANKYHQIFAANRPMLEDPDKIYPGQVLRIPPEETART